MLLNLVNSSTTPDDSSSLVRNSSRDGTEHFEGEDGTLLVKEFCVDENN
jgi:hypothetical protein